MLPWASAMSPESQILTKERPQRSADHAAPHDDHIIDVWVVVMRLRGQGAQRGCRPDDGRRCDP